MKLRKLQLTDAPYMLEWMHDEDVCQYLRADFKSKTIEDCENFIMYSLKTEKDLHLAIVNEENQYMGTASLKNIDYEKGYAEFGISMRKVAMGKGYSQFGMKEILRKGIEELGLNRIYWCVDKENIRANRFYQKMNYEQIKEVPIELQELYHYSNQLKWYIYDGK